MSNPFGPKGLDVRVWNGVEIHRRPSDGYVNATAMCRANGKEWANYRQNERTQNYLTDLAEALVAETPCGAMVPWDSKGPQALLAKVRAGLVETITTGPNHLRGTWVHPRLAVDLARWISTKFSVWMDGWFLEAGATPQAPAAPQPEPKALPPRRGTPKQPDRSLGEGLNRVGDPWQPPKVVFSAPSAWSDLVERYLEDVEEQNRDVPLHQRRRSMKFARPLAQHMGQWLIDNCAQLVLPSTGQPATPPALQPTMPPASTPAAADPDATPLWEGRNLPMPVRTRQRLLGQHFESGYRIASPELANLLGISTSALNAWCRRYGAGAERNGWRLIGQGKIAAGKLGAHIPPGRPSWIFERI